MRDKKYRIEEFLAEVRWSKTQLAKELWVTPSAVSIFFNKGARTLSKQMKHTEAFNRLFETNYSYRYLFEVLK